jgi:hypothetical protein
MPSTYTLISSNVLSTATASVTFSAIPSTYTDLVIRASARTDAAGQSRDSVYLEFNGSGSSYSNTFVRGTSTAATSGTFAFGIASPRGADADTATANTFGSVEWYVPNYAGSTNKPVSVFGVQENNTTTANDANIEAVAGLWSNTAAITSIVVKKVDGTNFVSGSSFYLYGISKS